MTFSQSDPSGITPTNVQMTATPPGDLKEDGEYFTQTTGISVTLTCRATGGVKYLFYHNGKVVRHWGDAEYKIATCSPSDVGSYSCRASDGGTAMSAVSVKSLTLVLGGE